ncbi:hypothetical protein JAAARDRAFT_203321 [Jaapia argillacea MUCL 33604]|uniref:Uncharacterized protein n=1 Tax=Jaapia argillacea MUCL 33604 TaxID=933084 RepID=A0A067Q551_9AGAM|nr:hypothetical protein JAAARDRAFT_203321 [Jaapia argillacea MUCL 33604]
MVVMVLRGLLRVEIIPPHHSLLLTPSRVRKSLVLSSGTAEGLFRMAFTGEWGIGSAFKWYRRQRSTGIRKIQLMKEESTFSHEYILVTLRSGKTIRFERSPDPKAHPDAVVHPSGCEAYDTIDTGSEDLGRAEEHICVGEIVFQDGIDLLFIISVCFAMTKDTKARRYTLQEYNCYFFARTIYTLAIRYAVLHAPRPPNRDKSAIRWDIVPDSLPHLHAIVRDHPYCTSTQSFLRLQYCMSSVVAETIDRIFALPEQEIANNRRWRPIYDPYGSRPKYIPYTWGERVLRSIYEVITALTCGLTSTALQDMLWGETVLDKLSYTMKLSTSPARLGSASASKDLLRSARPALSKILLYLISRTCALQDEIASGRVTSAMMENNLEEALAEWGHWESLVDALLSHVNEIYSDVIPSALSAWLFAEGDCLPASLEVRVVSMAEQRKAANAHPTLILAESLHSDWVIANPSVTTYVRGWNAYGRSLDPHLPQRLKGHTRVPSSFLAFYFEAKNLNDTRVRFGPLRNTRDMTSGRYDQAAIWWREEIFDKIGPSPMIARSSLRRYRFLRHSLQCREDCPLLVEGGEKSDI